MTTGFIFDIKRYAIHDGPGIRATVFMKGCPLACRWCHNPEGIEHIHRAVDTSGYACHETLMSVAEHTDLFLYDLKMMDSDKHEKYTGLSNRLIIENLLHRAREKVDLIIRLPLIPGVNDDVESLDRIGLFKDRLAGVEKVHILPYRDFQRSKYTRFEMHYGHANIALPARDMLFHAKKRLENFNLEVTIGG
jgi:pyruvate formate lyase activating enzyme